MTKREYVQCTKYQYLKLIPETSQFDLDRCYFKHCSMRNCCRLTGTALIDLVYDALKQYSITVCVITDVSYSIY